MAASSQRSGTRAMCVAALVRRRGSWPGSVDASRRLPSSRSISRMVVSAASEGGRPRARTRRPRPAPRSTAAWLGKFGRSRFHGATIASTIAHCSSTSSARVAASRRRQAVQDQPFVGLRQAYAEERRRRESPCGRCEWSAPGRAPWRRSRAKPLRPAGRARGARSGASLPSASTSNGGCGARSNWIAIVVSRRGSRLPVRI